MVLASSYMVLARGTSLGCLASARFQLMLHISLIAKEIPLNWSIELCQWLIQRDHLGMICATAWGAPPRDGPAQCKVYSVQCTVHSLQCPDCALLSCRSVLNRIVQMSFAMHRFVWFDTVTKQLHELVLDEAMGQCVMNSPAKWNIQCSGYVGDYDLELDPITKKFAPIWLCLFCIRCNDLLMGRHHGTFGLDGTGNHDVATPGRHSSWKMISKQISQKKFRGDPRSEDWDTWQNRQVRFFPQSGIAWSLPLYNVSILSQVLVSASIPWSYLSPSMLRMDPDDITYL